MKLLERPDCNVQYNDLMDWYETDCGLKVTGELARPMDSVGRSALKLAHDNHHGFHPGQQMVYIEGTVHKDGNFSWLDARCVH